MGKKAQKNKDLPTFDKYKYYTMSVQSPDTDVEFLGETFEKLRGYKAHIMREDFCGTFAICCEWVKLDKKNQAIGVDLDPEPIAYGRQQYFNKLEDSQKKRVEICQENVLSPQIKKAELVCGLNFSYFGFKDRLALKNYFQNVYQTLTDDGVFIVDCFGGSKCYEANEEETEYEDENYSYYWDQDDFNPITNEAKFYIHFKRKGEKKREKVFSYDWRMWSIPEIREIMKEVGFKSSHVYWEGTDEDGEGDGNFERTESGEDCESWIAYVAGAK